MKHIAIFAAVALLLVVLLAACITPNVDLPSRASGGITGVSLTSDTVTAEKLVLSSTAVTVTNNMIITPTHSFYNLSAAGAVALTLGADCADGQLLYLRGDDNQTITISDTNIYTTDGNSASIGQYDLIGWQCFDDKWYHLFKSANS